MQNNFTQSAAAASILLVMAFASVAILTRRDAASRPDADANMTVQEFLTSGPTGVRTWEVFVGRDGTVCGSTAAPGMEPRNFVMRYSPAKVALDDDTAVFRAMWATFCGTPGAPARAGSSRMLADVQ